MGRRYKKWSELSFWERMYIDEAAYESARFDAECTDAVCDCLCSCICNKATQKLFAYIIAFILILAIIILIFMSFAAPYYFVYVAFCSDREELFLNNQTYYNYFTTLNQGVEYKSDKLKIAYLNIPSAIVYTFTLTSFLIPKLYDNLKAKSFLILFLLTNTAVVALDVFDILLFSKLSGSFENYAKSLDEKYGYIKETKGGTYNTQTTYLIPINKRSDFGSFLARRAFAIFNIIFCLIYYYLIYRLYSSKRKCEEEGYIESDATTNLTTGGNLNLNDVEQNTDSNNLPQFVPPSKDLQNNPTYNGQNEISNSNEFVSTTVPLNVSNL